MTRHVLLNIARIAAVLLGIFGCFLVTRHCVRLLERPPVSAARSSHHDSP